MGFFLQGISSFQLVSLTSKLFAVGFWSLYLYIEVVSTTKYTHRRWTKFLKKRICGSGNNLIVERVESRNFWISMEGAWKWNFTFSCVSAISSIFIIIISRVIIIIILETAERTPDGAVCAPFLCPQEMARLHGIIRELRMPVFNRNDMVRMSFSQSFFTVLELTAGDDVSFSDLSVSSSCLY